MPSWLARFSVCWPGTEKRVQPGSDLTVVRCRRKADLKSTDPPTSRSKVETTWFEGSAITGDGLPLRYRDAVGAVHQSTLAAVHSQDIANAQPWRHFRSHRGQRHYSGFYWCATTGGHVVYESRLELARLLLADFDPRTVRIAAQPFLIEADVGGKSRRHVPDFMLVDVDQVVTVVNVKPAERLADPAVAAALAWAAQAIESRGWRCETWSGTDETTMCNVRFLAGYRRPAVVDHEVIELVRQEARAGESVDELERRLGAAGPRAQIRPAILHLLWLGWLRTDLTLPLCPDTLLERAS